MAIIAIFDPPNKPALWSSARRRVGFSTDGAVREGT
jgi:hypothetical protein